MNERELSKAEMDMMIIEAERADCLINASVEDGALSISMMGNTLALSSLIIDLVGDLLNTVPDGTKETVKEAILKAIENDKSRTGGEL